MQIKGDKQLDILKESVPHMPEKFDNFEKDRKEKEELINNLKEEVSIIEGRIETRNRKQ